MTFRIHDLRHQTVSPTYLHSDRFNRRIFIRPGWNRIRISLTDVKSAPGKRLMDMTEIRDFSFFASRLKQPLTLYVDKVYLSMD